MWIGVPRVGGALIASVVSRMNGAPIVRNRSLLETSVFCSIDTRAKEIACGVALQDVRRAVSRERARRDIEAGRFHITMPLIGASKAVTWMALPIPLHGG
jgi:hypothetical protein